jgi:hypothetical protein
MTTIFLVLALAASLVANAAYARRLRDARRAATEDTILLDVADTTSHTWTSFGVKFDSGSPRETYRKVWAFVRAYPPDVSPPANAELFKKIRAVVDRYDGRELAP